MLTLAWQQYAAYNLLLCYPPWLTKPKLELFAPWAQGQDPLSRAKSHNKSPWITPLDGANVEGRDEGSADIAKMTCCQGRMVSFKNRPEALDRGQELCDMCLGPPFVVLGHVSSGRH
jgi:hypothetical protein